MKNYIKEKKRNNYFFIKYSFRTFSNINFLKSKNSFIQILSSGDFRQKIVIKFFFWICYCSLFYGVQINYNSKNIKR